MIGLKEYGERSFTTGAFGEMLSMFTCEPFDDVLTLPAASVAVAVNVLAPSVSADDVTDHIPFDPVETVPSNVVPLYSLITLLASAVPVTTGVATFAD